MKSPRQGAREVNVYVYIDFGGFKFTLHCWQESSLVSFPDSRAVKVCNPGLDKDEA